MLGFAPGASIGHFFCARLSHSVTQAIEKPSIWGIFELPPFENIVDDRVILIGDAALVTT